jgi:hypothetical protein
LPDGLSLILLLVLLVFGVHTWNTPFSSIRHQTEGERCTLREIQSPADSVVTFESAFFEGAERG